MEFYEYMGEERNVASRPDISNYALRSLLAVKYLLNRNGGESFVDDNGDTKIPGFEYIKTSGGYYIYENKNFVPYGISYDYYMTKEFCDGYSDDVRAALMLKAMLLTDEQISLYGDTMQNIEDAVNQNDDFFEDYAGFENDETDAFADESSSQENEASSEDFESGETLDYFNDDNGITLYLDHETMSQDCERLSHTAAYEFSEQKGRFTASVNREKNSLVYFQIPYDEGWSATVNGQKAVIEKVNMGFMAVMVPAGTSHIVLSYRTPLLSEGILITAAAFMILAIYLLISHFTIRNMRDKTVYPEGEELLKMWHKQDIEDIRRENELEAESEKSILDDDPIEIPQLNEGFEGGFQIDTSFVDNPSGTVNDFSDETSKVTENQVENDEEKRGKHEK